MCIDYGGNGLGAPPKRGRTAVGATRIGLTLTVPETREIMHKNSGNQIGNFYRFLFKKPIFAQDMLACWSLLETLWRLSI